MKGKRFTEEQIIGVLKEAESGLPQPDLLRKHGISQGTFYCWKAKYGGLDISEARRLKSLEDENRRLKRLVADPALDIQILKDINSKKMVTPTARRDAVGHAIQFYGISRRRGRGLVGLRRSSLYYKGSKRPDGPLREAIREVAGRRKRWGVPMIARYLRRKGWKDNYKRIERIYRQEGLQVRRRKRKKMAAVARTPLEQTTRPNQVWAMDFVHDAAQGGRKLKLLTLIDCHTRECLAIKVDSSIGGHRVARVLDAVAAGRGYPGQITTDNGPEFIGNALEAWAYARGVTLDPIEPGKPSQNGYIESFNGTLRNKCLNEHWFMSMADARQIIEDWRVDYNERGPTAP